jgi:hypothetical protein
MTETPDQSVSEAFDDILNNKLNCLLDAESSALQNHQVGRDGAHREVYIIADIRPQDLNTNNTVEFTEKVHEWIREDGCPCDEPGLIVPAEFGGEFGKPAEEYNIIPWSKLVSFIIISIISFLDGYD